MKPENFFYFFLIGIIAGNFSGMFGVGGGIIIVPLLVFFFHFSLKQASVISLIALLAPVGALGVWQYVQKGLLSKNDWIAGGFIALGIFIGAATGAQLALNLPQEKIQKMFSVVLILAAIRIWFLKKT